MTIDVQSTWPRDEAFRRALENGRRMLEQQNQYECDLFNSILDALNFLPEEFDSVVNFHQESFRPDSTEHVVALNFPGCVEIRLLLRRGNQAWHVADWGTEKAVGCYAVCPSPSRTTWEFHHHLDCAIARGVELAEAQSEKPTQIRRQSPAERLLLALEDWVRDLRGCD